MQLMNDEIPAGHKRFAPLHRWPSDATRQSRQCAARTGRRPLHRLAEQMRGRYDALLKAEPQNLLREQERLIGTQMVLSAFSILYLDQPSVDKLLELRQKRSTRKRYADVIIATMALAGGQMY
jgi:hypothetical protein